MIILYKMRHKNHLKPIELCGKFRDIQHFQAFQKNENFRGWYVVGTIKILKETND